MNIIRTTIRKVAITLLMVFLVMPAAVHAHTLEVLGTEASHVADGGCHDADSDADRNSSETHQSDVRCCDLDTPYLQPSTQSLALPAATDVLACAFGGRQLDGYAKRIYKPPR